MSTSVAPTPTWSTWRDMKAVLIGRRHMRNVSVIATTVGTVFVVMNQLGVILDGTATPIVWLKVALTYLTPIVVSSLAVLSNSYQPNDSELEE